MEEIGEIVGMVDVGEDMESFLKLGKTHVQGILGIAHTNANLESNPMEIMNVKTGRQFYH